MTNLILLQNNLRNQVSHHYLEAFSWRQACHSNGTCLQIFSHKKINRLLSKHLQATPCFTYESDGIYLKNKNLNDIHRFVGIGQVFYEDVKKVSAHFSENDVLIIPYTSPSEMYGMALWLDENHHLQPIKQVVFIFHTPDLNWDISTNNKVSRGNVTYYQYAALRLQHHFSKGIVSFLSTNDHLSHLLKNVMQLPVNTCPVTIGYFTAEEFPENDSEPAPTKAHVGIMGQSRNEKGNELIPQIIQNFCKTCPDKNVFLQLNNPKQAQTYHQFVKDAPPKQVQAYIGTYSPHAYLQQLNNIDILLLPYDPKRYTHRISGIFAEAVAYGIPCVVPDQTWMSEQIREGRGSGLIFTEFSHNAIYETLINASAQYDALKKEASQIQDAWKNTQSTRALLSFILKDQSEDYLDPILYA